MKFRIRKHIVSSFSKWSPCFHLYTIFFIIYLSFNLLMENIDFHLINSRFDFIEKCQIN